MVPALDGGKGLSSGLTVLLRDGALDGGFDVEAVDTAEGFIGFTVDASDLSVLDRREACER